MRLTAQQVTEAVACPWCWHRKGEPCQRRGRFADMPHETRRRAAERAQLQPAPDLVDPGVHLTREQADLARYLVGWVLGYGQTEQVREPDLLLLDEALRGAPPHRAGQPAGG